MENTAALLGALLGVAGVILVTLIVGGFFFVVWKIKKKKEQAPAARQETPSPPPPPPVDDGSLPLQPTEPAENKSPTASERVLRFVVMEVRATGVFAYGSYYSLHWSVSDDLSGETSVEQARNRGPQVVVQWGNSFQIPILNSSTRIIMEIREYDGSQLIGVPAQGGMDFHQFVNKPANRWLLNFDRVEALFFITTVYTESMLNGENTEEHQSRLHHNLSLMFPNLPGKCITTALTNSAGFSNAVATLLGIDDENNMELAKHNEARGNGERTQRGLRLQEIHPGTKRDSTPSSVIRGDGTGMAADGLGAEAASALLPLIGDNLLVDLPVDTAEAQPTTEALGDTVVANGDQKEDDNSGCTDSNATTTDEDEDDEEDDTSMTQDGDEGRPSSVHGDPFHLSDFTEYTSHQDTSRNGRTSGDSNHLSAVLRRAITATQGIGGTAEQGASTTSADAPTDTGSTTTTTTHVLHATHSVDAPTTDIPLSASNNTLANSQNSPMLQPTTPLAVQGQEQTGQTEGHRHLPHRQRSDSRGRRHSVRTSHSAPDRPTQQAREVRVSPPSLPHLQQRSRANTRTHTTVDSHPLEPVSLSPPRSVTGQPSQNRSPVEPQDSHPMANAPSGASGQVQQQHDPNSRESQIRRYASLTPPLPDVNGPPPNRLVVGNPEQEDSQHGPSPANAHRHPQPTTRVSNWWSSTSSGAESHWNVNSINNCTNSSNRNTHNNDSNQLTTGIAVPVSAFVSTTHTYDQHQYADPIQEPNFEGLEGANTTSLQLPQLQHPNSPFNSNNNNRSSPSEHVAFAPMIVVHSPTNSTQNQTSVEGPSSAYFPQPPLLTLPHFNEQQSVSSSPIHNTYHSEQRASPTHSSNTQHNSPLHHTQLSLTQERSSPVPTTATLNSSVERASPVQKSYLLNISQDKASLTRERALTSQRRDPPPGDPLPLPPPSSHVVQYAKSERLPDVSDSPNYAALRATQPHIYNTALVPSSSSPPNHHSHTPTTYIHSIVHSDHPPNAQIPQIITTDIVNMVQSPLGGSSPQLAWIVPPPAPEESAAHHAPQPQPAPQPVLQHSPRSPTPTSNNSPTWNSIVHPLAKNSRTLSPIPPAVTPTSSGNRISGLTAESTPPLSPSPHYPKVQQHQLHSSPSNSPELSLPAEPLTLANVRQWTTLHNEEAELMHSQHSHSSYGFLQAVKPSLIRWLDDRIRTAKLDAFNLPPHRVKMVPDQVAQEWCDLIDMHNELVRTVKTWTAYTQVASHDKSRLRGLLGECLAIYTLGSDTVVTHLVDCCEKEKHPDEEKLFSIIHGMVESTEEIRANIQSLANEVEKKCRPKSASNNISKLPLPSQQGKPLRRYELATVASAQRAAAARRSRSASQKKGDSARRRNSSLPHVQSVALIGVTEQEVAGSPTKFLPTTSHTPNDIEERDSSQANERSGHRHLQHKPDRRVSYSNGESQLESTRSPSPYPQFPTTNAGLGKRVGNKHNINDHLPPSVAVVERVPQPSPKKPVPYPRHSEEHCDASKTITYTHTTSGIDSSGGSQVVLHLSSGARDYLQNKKWNQEGGRSGQQHQPSPVRNSRNTTTRPTPAANTSRNSAARTTPNRSGSGSPIHLATQGSAPGSRNTSPLKQRLKGTTKKKQYQNITAAYASPTGSVNEEVDDDPATHEDNWRYDISDEDTHAQPFSSTKKWIGKKLSKLKQLRGALMSDKQQQTRTSSGSRQQHPTTVDEYTEQAEEEDYYDEYLDLELGNVANTAVSLSETTTIETPDPVQHHQPYYNAALPPLGKPHGKGKQGVHKPPTAHATNGATLYRNPAYARHTPGRRAEENDELYSPFGMAGEHPYDYVPPQPPTYGYDHHDEGYTPLTAYDRHLRATTGTPTSAIRWNPNPPYRPPGMEGLIMGGSPMSTDIVPATTDNEPLVNNKFWEGLNWVRASYSNTPDSTTAPRTPVYNDFSHRPTTPTGTDPPLWQHPYEHELEHNAATRCSCSPSPTTSPTVGIHVKRGANMSQHPPVRVPLAGSPTHTHDFLYEGTGGSRYPDLAPPVPPAYFHSSYGYN